MTKHLSILALGLVLTVQLGAENKVNEKLVGTVKVSGVGKWWNHKTELNALRLPPPPAGAEIFYYDITGDGKPDVLRTVTADGTPVQWIDDNANMKVGDLSGDLVDDCLMIDRNRDGKFGGPEDIIIDYADTDGDGKADIQTVVENKTNVKGGKRWGGGHYMLFFDLDKDNVFNYMDYNTFQLRCWLHDGLAYFYSDYIGDSRFLKIHNDAASVSDVRLNWENPFEFIDADGDGLTEMTIRLCDVQPAGSKGRDPNGNINWGAICVDLDNDNTQENPLDLDMTIGFFSEKGTSYTKYTHIYKHLRGLPEADGYFDDPRWRQNSELIYPDRAQCFDFIFKDAKWERAFLSYDEDGDCKRWERVEFWNHKNPPTDLWASGRGNGGMDDHNQSDPCGDRGEWDMDFSGHGNIYISPMDGKIHLYGAEAGAWKVDQRAQYFQNMGGLYDVYGDGPDKKRVRQAPDAPVFPIVKYEDTDGNGFFDKISFDWNCDKVFEEVVSAKELGISDEAKVIPTAGMKVKDYQKVYKTVAAGLWKRGCEAVKAARKLGINPDWYALYMSPRSLRQHYECGFWLQLYLYHDIVDLARRKGDSALENRATKAYFSGNWKEIM